MQVLNPVIIMLVIDIVVYGLLLLVTLGIIVYELYDEWKSERE